MVYLAELEVRITVRIKIVRIYARSGPHVHGHKRLEDYATENVKLWRRRICGFTGICHCTRLRGLKCAIICHFPGRMYTHKLIKSRSAFCRLMMQM